ncbi:MAG: ATP-dependent Clp protease ATP-binding subunit ClpC, partial [Ruminococcus sp.]|nr:ATP-dependent Clp protease ATP-binding subunit ClpC [Ruminococcus sp.]
NVGARRITEKSTAFGFTPEKESGETNVREMVLSELKQVFRPEFLNRVDDIIVFNKLTKPEIKEIAGKMLETLSKRLSDLGVQVSFTDKAIEKVADEGFDDTYGARPLRRAITTNIEDRLSERMLEADFDSTKPIVCDYDGEKYTFNTAE